MKVGEYNRLRLDRFTGNGAYLVDEEDNDVLLPTKYIHPDFDLDDMLNVFVYRDNEQRIISTTLKPYLTVNQFAFLEIAEVTAYGAFAIWGIEKHLMIPFREQAKPLEEGKKYMIYMYIDKATQRLVGSTKVGKFLGTPEGLNKNQELQGIVWEKTEIGYKIICNHQFQALLYASEVKKTLRVGEKINVYFKNQREDGKIDLSIQPEGYEKIDRLSEHLLDLLNEYDGFLPLTDKTPPHSIHEVTGWSKKIFKQVVGKLYKERVIAVNENGISLLNQ